MAQEVSTPVSQLNLKDAGVNAIVWGSGFRYDFDWVKLPIFDDGGDPAHRRGVTQLPGIYFLGLRSLYKRKSSFLLRAGPAEDAAYLAEQISNLRDGLEVLPSEAFARQQNLDRRIAMRYLIRGKFTAQALRTIQDQGMVDRVERAKERFRAMGAEIQQAYLVPTNGGLELVAIAEAEEQTLAAILFAINSNGHIEEEAVRIMTPEEMDQVIARSRSVSLPKG